MKRERPYFQHKSLRGLFYRPWQSFIFLLAFIFNTFGSIPTAQAQEFALPAPGAMVYLSPAFNPPVLKGIKVHADNPFKFDFILDKGDSQSSNDQLKEESTQLIKYFLASLTIPEKDLWVNLSPYEKDRIVPESFGQTEMGRDLLAQDYMLKQITASLIYPEDEVGKKFWKRIYEEAQKKFGTTQIPVNTFNKVWIVPEKAVVYENAKTGTAYVVESKLKVMLETDYLAQEKNTGVIARNEVTKQSFSSQIVREIIIPELTKEINENKNFAKLRQIYNSLILSTWYKKKIKDSILSQVYADKNKIAGVNIDNPKEKQKIYEQYLLAFNKGVYNYIKEDPEASGGQTVPRKYFSGGITSTELAMNVLKITSTMDQAQLGNPKNLAIVSSSIKVSVDHAMLTLEEAINQYRANKRIEPRTNGFVPVGIIVIDATTGAIRRILEPNANLDLNLTNDEVAEPIYLQPDLTLFTQDWTDNPVLKAAIQDFNDRKLWKRIEPRESMPVDAVEPETPSFDELGLPVVKDWPRSLPGHDWRQLTAGMTSWAKEQQQLPDSILPPDRDLRQRLIERAKGVSGQFLGLPLIRQEWRRAVTQEQQTSQQINQHRRNLWRVLNLMDIYFLPYEKFPEMSAQLQGLVSNMVASRLIESLLASSIDDQWTDRLQGALMLVYLDSESLKYPHQMPERNRKVYDSISRSGIDGEILRNQYPLLLLATVSLGIVRSYPDSRSAYPQGTDINNTGNAALAAAGGWSNLILETSEWVTFLTSYLPGEAKASLKWLQQQKSSGGTFWPGFHERHLNNAGGDLEAFNHQFPYIEYQRAQLIRTNAMALSKALMGAYQQANFDRMALAIRGFNEATNGLRSQGALSVLTGAYFRESVSISQLDKMALVQQMMFVVNDQIVPAGYFIHFGLKRLNGDIVLSPPLGAEIMAHQFIKAQDGREFDQIIVDVEDGEGDLAYHIGKEIVLPITIIIATVSSGAVVSEQRWTPRKYLQYMPLNLNEMKHIAQQTQFPLSEVIGSVGYHEAQHAYERGIEQRQRDMTKLIVKYSEKGKPATFDRDKETFEKELSAMIQEAARNYPYFLTYWNLRANESADATPPYKTGFEIIRGYVSEHSENGIPEALNALHLEFTGTPLPQFQSRFLVLPVYKSAVADVPVKASTPNRDQAMESVPNDQNYIGGDIRALVQISKYNAGDGSYDNELNRKINYRKALSKVSGESQVSISVSEMLDYLERLKKEDPYAYEFRKILEFIYSMLQGYFELPRDTLDNDFLLETIRRAQTTRNKFYTSVDIENFFSRTIAMRDQLPYREAIKAMKYSIATTRLVQQGLTSMGSQEEVGIDLTKGESKRVVLYDVRNPGIDMVLDLKRDENNRLSFQQDGSSSREIREGDGVIINSYSIRPLIRVQENGFVLYGRDSNILTVKLIANDTEYVQNLIYRILVAFEDNTFDTIKSLFEKLERFSSLLGDEGKSQLNEIRNRFMQAQEKYNALKSWEYEFNSALFFDKSDKAKDILQRVAPYKEELGEKYIGAQAKYEARFGEKKQTGEGLKQALKPDKRYFDALEVKEIDITDEEDLKRVHRRVMLKYHPDKNPNDPIAEEKTKLANEANDIIGQFLRLDHAMSAKYGGIDLTPSPMNLQVNNTGESIKFHLDPALLQQLQSAPGFVPVIINIEPLKNLTAFLGIN